LGYIKKKEKKRNLLNRKKNLTERTNGDSFHGSYQGGNKVTSKKNREIK